jgi:GntR family transcriptional regulator
MQSPVAAYHRVAEVLRERILAGEIRPTAQVPTEMELCRQFSVSRITVRRALQILEDEALVIRQQGSGTYVSPKPSRKIPILNADFAESMSRYAPRLQRCLEEMTWRLLDKDLAVRLGTICGEKVLYARRLDLLRSKPVAVDELYILERYGRHLNEDDLRQTDLVGRWQAREQVKLYMSRQTVEAVGAEKPQTRWLKVASGTPLLKEGNLFYLPGNRVAGGCWTYYHGQRFQMTSVFTGTGVLVKRV